MNNLYLQRCPNGGWIVSEDGEPLAAFTMLEDMMAWLADELTPTLPLEAGVGSYAVCHNDQ